jgi:protein-L-isoaspartate(D-aspartate) O-methyltransferase
MTEAAKLRAGDRVLEIGTGSGYQAAVLAELANKVYTIEIHDQLAERTRMALAAAGYSEIQLRVGDGYRGWPEAGPFDAIFITCATPEIPPALLEQLAVGGRLIAPVGEDEQVLQVFTKGPSGMTTENLLDVRFGRMLGEVRRDR